MIQFRGRVSIPKFEDRKYTDKLKEEMETQLRQAAREWLRAVIPKVPVYTGTSRGTLQPLGRYLRVAVPITPEVSRKGRGPHVGAAASHFEFERRGKRFLFKFNLGIFYTIQNEFYNAPNPPFNLRNPTPWNALLAGQAAFEQYITHVLPTRMPRVKDFIRYKSVRINPR